MAADTYEPILGLILQGTGNNNNAWGTILNNSMIKLAARATAGISFRTVTGGTLDLSGSPPPATARQDIDATQYFSGTLASHQTVIVPSLAKTWVFANFTTGAFQLFVKTAGQATPAQVPQGSWKFLWCEGSIVSRMDDDQIGSIRMTALNTTQPGEMLCNGASLLRADFPRLFQKMSTLWGAADGTHFSLPDFVTGGRFPRCAGSAISVGTYQSSCNLSHTHTGSATTGTVSADHTHNTSVSGSTSGTDRSLDHLHSNPQACQNVSSTGGGQFATGYNTSVATGAMDRSIDHLHSWSGTFGSGGISANHTHFVSFTTSGGSADAGEARPNAAGVYMFVVF